jgi:hypothetical protein
MRTIDLTKVAPLARITPRKLFPATHLKPVRLPRRKAVTIGIGFLCSDGIVLCSDTQVTWQQFHKYYEHKIRSHGGDGWTLAFTYSGNPSVMKMFDGKFANAAASYLNNPPDARTVQNMVETVLSTIDVLDNDPNSLCMLCGIVIPKKEMLLIHTEGKVVSTVDEHHFVGCGDSSVLRYLIPTLTKHSSGYSAWQAVNIGVYLTLQAKRYVDGCGGDTDILILKPNGHTTTTEAYHIEQELLKLEFLMDRTATGLFDIAMSDEEFQDHLKRFVKAVEDEREELKLRSKLNMLFGKHENS